MSDSSERRSNKLAKPPVKLACLSCRTSRIRCDGREVCTNCSTKNRTCTYTKSNRGGPRVSRKKAALTAEQRQPDVSKLPTPPADEQLLESFEPPDESFWDLVTPMILPGAGLKDVDSDRIFDSIFGGQQPQNDPNLRHESMDIDVRPTHSQTPICRVYQSNIAILNAYYIFIHPFFPLLPPPNHNLFTDEPLAAESNDFEPSSPISLALSAILVLIPHPDDPDPKRPESVLLRRQRAQIWAQSAMDAIEIESEMIASSVSPADALSSDPESFHSEPLQSDTPVELESLQAYLLLAVYEYAQRGNIAKMRNRATQAYDAAIRLSLQDGSNTILNNQFSEARRRAWWMTYTVVLQSSIVSSLAPILQIEYRCFKTPLPTVNADPETWHAFLDSQQLILQCTQFTVALKKALDSNSDLASIHLRMAALDKEIDSLSQRYNWVIDSSPTDIVNHNEQVVAASLKAQAQIKFNSARIKLHRYRAFLDAPVFTKRHCDLQQQKTGNAPACSCSSTFRGPASPISDQSTDSASSTGAAISSPESLDSNEALPFSSPESARACMRAALKISKAFEALPYPNPTLTPNCLAPTFLSNTSLNAAPRTMPAFACCAMQSSYALLMLCKKSHEWNRNAAMGTGFHNGLEELYAGLQRVLGALQNYSIAFEALDGMRSQVQEAFDGTVQSCGRSSYSNTMSMWM